MNVGRVDRNIKRGGNYSQIVYNGPQLYLRVPPPWKRKHSLMKKCVYTDFLNVNTFIFLFVHKTRGDDTEKQREEYYQFSYFFFFQIWIVLNEYRFQGDNKIYKWETKIQ